MCQSCQYKKESWIKTFANFVPTLCQPLLYQWANVNFEDILTLGQRCANMLGQRWDTLHLQRWPNIKSQRWPNKVNNVGPTLGQRMRAVWEAQSMTWRLKKFPKVFRSLWYLLPCSSSFVIKHWSLLVYNPILKNNTSTHTSMALEHEFWLIMKYIRTLQTFEYSISSY